MPWAMTGSKNTARETRSLLSLRETAAEREGRVYICDGQRRLLSGGARMWGRSQPGEKQATASQKEGIASAKAPRSEEPGLKT